MTYPILKKLAEEKKCAGVFLQCEIKFCGEFLNYPSPLTHTTGFVFLIKSR